MPEDIDNKDGGREKKEEVVENNFKVEKESLPLEENNFNGEQSELKLVRKSIGA